MLYSSFVYFMVYIKYYRYNSVHTAMLFNMDHEIDFLYFISNEEDPILLKTLDCKNKKYQIIKGKKKKKTKIRKMPFLGD